MEHGVYLGTRSRTRPHSESYGRGAEGRLDRDGTPTTSRSLDLARSHRVSGSWALTTSGGTCGAVRGGTLGDSRQRVGGRTVNRLGPSGPPRKGTGIKGGRRAA